MVGNDQEITVLAEQNPSQIIGAFKQCLIVKFCGPVFVSSYYIDIPATKSLCYRRRNMMIHVQPNCQGNNP